MARIDRNARPTKLTESDRRKLASPTKATRSQSWLGLAVIIACALAILTLLDVTRAPACKVAGNSIPYYCAD